MAERQGKLQCRKVCGSPKGLGEVTENRPEIASVYKIEKNPLLSV